VLDAGAGVIEALRVLWISGSTGSSAVELLNECKRLCLVSTCEPRRALAALARSPPDVVIFDYGEPLAADLHLLQSAKRLYPSVPILMVTETHSEELAVWAFRARVWNYLVKPVPLRELKANLQKLAQLSRRREPVARQIERPGAIMPVQLANKPADAETAAIQRIIENVRRDHTTRHDAAQLARACGMSRFKFSRLFRSAFGCSYRSYVMRLRIETACRMLEEPNPSVTRVASTAGFTDPSYFARMFRRYMRQSPTQYARTASQRRPRKADTRRVRQR
jgi:AraC-like DNA-binding protein/CheY-like chemotaxis protein